MMFMRNIGAKALIGPLLLLACGREAGPSAERNRSAAAAAAAAPSTSADEAAPSTSAGEAAPSTSPSPDPQVAIQLLRVTAQQLLSDVRASGRKATLVNAWASWCGPCRRELPMLQALAINLKPQGVGIVLVSVDDPKDEAKALSFLKDNAITLPSYVVDGSVGAFKQGINPRWPGMLPASFLFDASGGLVHFWGGEAFENEIVPVVEALLAGREIPPETRYGLAPGKSEK